MALRSTLNKRCLRCLARGGANEGIGWGTPPLDPKFDRAGKPDADDGGAEVEEDTEVNADATLRAGDAERGFEVELESERE